MLLHPQPRLNLIASCNLFLSSLYMLIVRLRAKNSLQLLIRICFLNKLAGIVVLINTLTSVGLRAGLKWYWVLSSF